MMVVLSVWIKMRIVVGGKKKKVKKSRFGKKRKKKKERQKLLAAFKKPFSGLHPCADPAVCSLCPLAIQG